MKVVELCRGPAGTRPRLGRRRMGASAWRPGGQASLQLKPDKCCKSDGRVGGGCLGPVSRRCWRDTSDVSGLAPRRRSPPAIAPPHIKSLALLFFVFLARTSREPDRRPTCPGTWEGCTMRRKEKVQVPEAVVLPRPLHGERRYGIHKRDRTPQSSSLQRQTIPFISWRSSSGVGADFAVAQTTVSSHLFHLPRALRCFESTTALTGCPKV
jgi:hypothetical protein